MMELTTTLLYLSIAGLLALACVWVIHYGLVRGSLATLCRALWLLPLILAFFPKTKSESLPRTLSLKTIHVLLDDSESMSRHTEGVPPSELGQNMLEDLSGECSRLGCVTKVTKLSELSEDVTKGFTPLSQILLPWLYGTGGEPWMVMTDGGDSRPSESWDSKLQDFGKAGSDKNRGMIVGFKPKGLRNVWIETPQTPLFSFADKPVQIVAQLKRSRPDLEPETIQVQVVFGDKAVSTLNASFGKGESVVDVSTLIPPLPKGQHLLTIRALPTADESSVWDNTTYQEVEVMPNTVGLLHLLGAPSWDGRFLRRYLKSEPKYDLISFFILRDPADMQMVNERELSLIPFPVDRLFNEELPNFHAVIIQNFALYQFLEPTYQENLVRFVQNGGGLLFIGGPRALHSGDFTSSPLASILPFHTRSASGAGDSMTGRPVEKRLPQYDPNLSFKVEMAKPNASQRALANVYDEWENLKEGLEEQQGLQGLHRMDHVVFKENEYTPLLDARLPNGNKVPLAVASYPGKGRAVWIFSDSLWRVAQNPSANASREFYNDFSRSALTWLLRQEIRKPLILKNLRLSEAKSLGTSWQLQISGPAARYFRTDQSWRLEVCQSVIPMEDVLLEQTGPENWQLSGKLPSSVRGGQRCQAKVSGSHPAFGSLQSTVATVVPEVFADKEMSAAPNKLEDLARLTQADLVFSDSGELTPLRAWLEEITGTFGVALPSRFKTVRDFYWAFDQWWFWFCFLFLPLEVLVRRWPELTASSRRL